MNHETFDRIKSAGDIVAAGLTGSVILGLLPHVAAVLTIIWTAIRIYETDTCAKFVNWLRGE